MYHQLTIIDSLSINLIKRIILDKIDIKDDIHKNYLQESIVTFKIANLN